MDNNQGFLNGKMIHFDESRKIEIIEMIGRGASCITYSCWLYINGAKNKKMLLKEFVPTRSGFPIETIISIESVKISGKTFEGRYLPAAKEEYNDYLTTLDSIDKIISNIQIIDNKMARYIVSLPDKYNRKFELDLENHLYNAFMLFNYDSNDINQSIHQFSIEQRLVIAETLCRIVAKFHELNLVFCDLKPSNFLYDFDGATAILRLFDFDSVVILQDNLQLGDEYKTPGGTEFFSAPEVINNYHYKIGPLSDVYSLAAILLYFVLYEQLKADDLSLYTPKDFLKEDYFNLLMKSDTDNSKFNITKGFCMKFKKIIEKFADENPKNRYDRNNNQPAVQLADEIHILREIHENKGVHPEVILNYANKSKENIDILDYLITNISEG